MTDDATFAQNMWHGLNDCLNADRDIAIATATHWLEYHGAGFPDVPLMQERVRDDAKLWAASASQVELEAYVAAAVVELESAPITGRAMKRLAAMAWKRMDAEARAGFRNWIGEE